MSKRDLCREGSRWLHLCVLCCVRPVSAERSVLELTTCMSIWGWCELCLQKASFSLLSVKRETLCAQFSWRRIHFGKTHFPLGYYFQGQGWRRMLQQDRPVRAGSPWLSTVLHGPLAKLLPLCQFFCQRVDYHLLRFTDQTVFDAYRQYFKVL